ncbi:uncharacterized protein LOC121640352 [Melanotaenia boesemani]|uniref:uncharacterized protein LOC121640352 n=1 Tax=Melanotaenia boesemani TaxID=1250792 RepID=UPI001C046069|nr:uncharacterized protein LOC121640352 [Melanotaenia boesemani]
MLAPLFYLSAFIALTSANPETFTVNQELDISSCILTYYQQTYSKLYTNFTEDGFVICFDGFFNPQTSQDCIVGPKPSDDQVIYTLLQPDSTYESAVQQNVATISNNMTCSVKFEIVVNGNNVAITLSSFGSETALEFSSTSEVPMNCEVKVNAGVAETLAADTVLPNAYTDISGCRISEGGIKPGATKSFSTTCTTASCSIARSLTTTGCSNQERCDGNGVCLVMNTCTVTGPTIIDIQGTYNSVGDRCVYTLVPDSWVSGFGILVEFRERRRTDVSFVDSLTLRFTNLNTNIVLKTDGEVLVNGSPQTVNSTVHNIQDIELSKDHTGVLVKMTLSGQHISVSFDGTMAQIHAEGPAGSSMGGLCGDSSSFSSAKLSSESLPGCDTQYTEPADATINCTAMTELCNILRDPSFSSYNEVLDPAPYITACSETLCKYPAMDGLRCEFMWAYARAFSLRNNTLEDWWPKAMCNPPNSICQDRFCSDHEFCGMKYSGLPGCLCRAIFASSYKESNTLANPVICTPNTTSISLVGCLLEENNINYTRLNLIDETCKGEMDQESHLVTFSFNTSNTCGALITTNKTQVNYENIIMGQNRSSSLIFRRDQFNVHFSCAHAHKAEATAVTFRIKDNSVVQQMACGEFNYTVNMKTYSDPERTQLVDLTTDVKLDQRIWMLVDTEGLDGKNVVIVLDYCWATSHLSYSSGLKHYLIYNSCANPNDTTVSVETNGEDVFSTFSFNMFQFVGCSGDIYIHCKIRLCVLEGPGACVPDCSGGARKRRSAHPSFEPDDSGFVTMAWIN